MASAEESKVTSSGGGTNKIFLVMFLVNMLATLALGYFLMEAKMEISKQKDEAQKAIPKTKGDAASRCWWRTWPAKAPHRCK